MFLARSLLFPEKKHRILRIPLETAVVTFLLTFVMRVCCTDNEGGYSCHHKVRCPSKRPIFLADGSRETYQGVTTLIKWKTT